MDIDTPPRQKRQISTLATMIVAVATPATLALSYYHVTGDPTFQPLALSIERLAESGRDQPVMMIEAVIRFDDSDTGRARADRLAQSVHQAFYAKGLNARVLVQPTTESTGTDITYRVASSTFGPYPERQAARGIQASVEALAMNRRHQNQVDKVAREHRW